MTNLEKAIQEKKADWKKWFMTQDYTEAEAEKMAEKECRDALERMYARKLAAKLR